MIADDDRRSAAYLSAMISRPQVGRRVRGVGVFRFYFHLHTDDDVELDEYGLECPDLHGAYLQACRGIPDLAAHFLAAGRDPIGFRF